VIRPLPVALSAQICFKAASSFSGPPARGPRSKGDHIMFKGLGQMGDMSKMMKAAQEMQQKMAALQEEMHTIMVEGESGAGLVKATCTAKGELKSLDIDPSIFNSDDKEVVEDLILAAIKDAQAKAGDRAQEEMGKLTEGMGLPKDMKLPF
jgi:DNA-binding YbaB/EbfC family protein